jgi:hypothetical protein
MTALEAEPCPHCDQVVPASDRADHSAGLDRNRLDCPHQDLNLIRQNDRRRDQNWMHVKW